MTAVPQGHEHWWVYFIIVIAGMMCFMFCIVILQASCITVCCGAICGCCHHIICFKILRKSKSYERFKTEQEKNLRMHNMYLKRAKERHDGVDQEIRELRMKLEKKEQELMIRGRLKDMMEDRVDVGLQVLNTPRDKLQKMDVDQAKFHKYLESEFPKEMFNIKKGKKHEYEEMGTNLEGIEIRIGDDGLDSDTANLIPMDSGRRGKFKLPFGKKNKITPRMAGDGLGEDLEAAPKFGRGKNKITPRMDNDVGLGSMSPGGPSIKLPSARKVNFEEMAPLPLANDEELSESVAVAPKKIAIPKLKFPV